MTTKTRIRRHKFSRFWAPTAQLYRHVAIGVLGLLLFFVGIVVSFRTALRPFVQEIAQAWNGFMGIFMPRESVQVTNHFLGGFLLLLGGFLAYRGARGFVQRLFETTDSRARSGVVDVYLRRQQLARGPRIVAIGGGTGLSTLLRGLKQHSSNITAIVTVTDDGGSSGRLVKEMGMIPPGDMRNCLVALADAEKLMTDLFQHRFRSGEAAAEANGNGGGFRGHSLGNILIAGFLDQAGGDMDKAIELASDVLAIRGRVVPSTKEHVRLRAVMEDETEICGETAIASSPLKIRRLYIDPKSAKAHKGALEEIAKADLICIGPGSVYTSVIPNLLVPGIAQAIHDSQAIKAYVCNVMTQPGETDSFSAAEHLVAIEANVDARICDYVLVNTGVPTQESLHRYKSEEQAYVDPDVDRIRQMGYKAITGDYMSETDLVRHDPARVAARLMDLIYR